MDAKIFERPSKPCHVGIHWIALTEYSKMSTVVPGFQSFFSFFFSHFVLAKFTSSSIRVQCCFVAAAGAGTRELLGAGCVRVKSQQESQTIEID